MPLAQTSYQEQMTINRGNFLRANAKAFAGGVVSVPIRNAGIPVGLYLLVFQRGSDSPVGTEFALNAFSEQASILPCPFSSTLVGMNLFSCSPSPLPLPGGFQPYAGTMGRENYAYSTEFENATHPYSVATYSLGMLDFQNWITVQL